MSHNHAIDDQLVEMEAELEELKARFQEELAEEITMHTKKCGDLERRQINALKKEIFRIRKFIEKLPVCRCKFKPVVCNTCGKILRNRHTYNQHIRNTHRMSEMSFDGQTPNLEYQYQNYQGSGNGNSWGPPLQFHNYTSVANTSVSE